MRKVAHYFFYLPQNNHIYLPSRLIELGKKDDELAFILAHEIAHWLQGDMNTRGAKVPSSKGMWNDSECNADEMALGLIQKAGYSVDIAKKFRKKPFPIKRPECAIDFE